MASLFARLSASSDASRPVLHRALAVMGALVVLWVVVQATALVPSTTASAHQSAAEDATSPPVSAASGRSSVEIMTWGNAGAVLLLVAGGGYALYLRRRREPDATASALRPMGQLSLGPSHTIRLVACGGEVLLLGVSADDVTLLKTYPKDAFDDVAAASDILQQSADAARPAHTTTAHASMPASFSTVLHRVLGRDASA